MTQGRTQSIFISELSSPGARFQCRRTILVPAKGELAQNKGARMLVQFGNIQYGPLFSDSPQVGELAQ